MPDTDSWFFKEGVNVMVKTEGRLSNLEGQLQHLATKDDINKLKLGILIWLTPTIITTIGVFAGIFKYICQ